MATLDLHSDKMPFLDELRNRMRLIEKRQKTVREEEVVVIKKEEQPIDNDKLAGQADKLQSGWKVREELYGLLPAFRPPNQVADHKKKHKLHKNFKLKI
jgi:hypothetical protein